MARSHQAQSTGINSLGKAQANLEYATKELKSAQAAFEKAQERLNLANEGHQLANVELMNTLATVRGAAKVIPTLLK
jgi:hypothetical protein